MTSVSAASMGDVARSLDSSSANVGVLSPSSSTAALMSTVSSTSAAAAELQPPQQLPAPPPPPPLSAVTDTGQADGSHVVLLHIVDGESVQFVRGDSVEVVRGPATVQMVSSTLARPLPYPVHVPPGHMMQQVVDADGTLRHVILSPEIPAPPLAPPPTTTLPPPPVSAACESGLCSPVRYQCSPPPAAVPSSSSSACGVGGVGAATHLNYHLDERGQRRINHLRNKLRERRINSSNSPCHTVPTGTSSEQWAGGEQVSSGGSVGERSRRRRTQPSDTTTTSTRDNCQSPPDCSSHNTTSLLPSPQVGEVTSRAALITWNLVCDAVSSSSSTRCANAPADTEPESCDGVCYCTVAVVSLDLVVTELTASGAVVKNGQRHVLADCQSSGSHQLAPLRPATSYSVVLCKGGTSEQCCEMCVFSTLCDVPDPPRPPLLHSRTKNSLQLRWGACASDNGSRVRQYVLECEAGGGGFVEIYRGKSRQHTLNHLLAATAYRLRLTAVNSVGASQPSSVITVTTSAPPPAPPSSPQVLASTPHSLTISWTHEQPVDGFTVQVERVGCAYGFRPVYSGSDTEFVCTQLDANTEYLVRVRAHGDGGVSRWSHVARASTTCLAPPAPGRPSVRGRVHASQLRVQWTGPRDAASPLTYHVQVAEQPDDAATEDCEWSERYVGAQCDCMLSQLRPGTYYLVRVLCENAGGLSAASPTLAVCTSVVAPAVCATPRLVGRARSTGCHVTWSPPDFAGGQDTAALQCRYQLAVRALSPQADAVLSEHALEQVTVTDQQEDVDTLSPVWLMYCGSVCETSVSHLLPGRQYQLCVRAVNVVGVGAWSQWLQFCSAPAPPDRPAPPSLAASPTAVGSHSLLLTWQTPHDNGAAVTEYRVEAAVGATADYQSRYVGNELRHELRRLVPATGYCVRVAAANTCGWSAWSEPLVVATAAASPAAVARPSMLEVSAEQVLVGWQAPDSHGAAITHYHVEVQQHATTGCLAAVVHRADDVLDCTLLVDQLVPETAYKVRVQAVNSVGAGVFSPAVRVVTGCMPPAAPQLHVTHTAHNHVRLRWHVPVDSDGSTTATAAASPTAAARDLLVYNLQCRAKSGEFYTVYEGSSEQFKVARLTGSTQYAFRVCAANCAGEGEYSPVILCCTQAPPPPVVKGVRVLERKERSVRVEWQSVHIESSCVSPSSLNTSNTSINDDHDDCVLSAISEQQHTVTPHYIVELAPANKTTTASFCKVHSGSSSWCRLTELRAGCEYQLRVGCVMTGVTTNTTTTPVSYSSTLRFSTTVTASDDVRPASSSISSSSSSSNTTSTAACDNKPSSRRHVHKMQVGDSNINSSEWSETHRAAGLLLTGFCVLAVLLSAVIHQLMLFYTH